MIDDSVRKKRAIAHTSGLTSRTGAESNTSSYYLSIDTTIVQVSKTTQIENLPAKCMENLGTFCTNNSLF